MPIIPDNMISSLDAPFSLDGISMAVKSLGKGKTTGPDGYTDEFYQTYWNIISNSFFHAFSEFYENFALPNGWNDIDLIFIPKTNNPSSVRDYRPISLCNVNYRILSKVLAGRMKLVLNDLISYNQIAFIRGRSIHDNITVAQEIIHSIYNSKGKNPYVVVKIDLEKTFDIISWNVIFGMLNHLGFPDKFINCIESCITYATFRYCINNCCSNSFKAHCGIRQGDPISPYL
ncbi:hypothetical protein Cni_G26548 [Canna indica]|uniref:Reverse transcriptase domain-containing protein n=1 Tax=Canna indica TaxID=4628 RepID=A0AAQ3KZY3_9LILI|nr:hypothetical protein Cni_G26548 [Canna indica]